MGIISTTVQDNKTQAFGAAQVIAGDVILDRAVKIVKPKAPFMVRGYIDTPVGKILIANTLNLAIKQYAPTNTKAIYAADAVMKSAFIEAAKSFDIPGMLDELLAGVDIPEEAEAVAP